MLRIEEATLRKTRGRSANASLEKQAHGEQEARRLVAEGLAIAGLSDEDLKKLPGSDPRKIAVARVVWERTIVGMPWLAEHLHLRSGHSRNPKAFETQRRKVAKDRNRG